MFYHQNGGDALLTLDGQGNAVKVSACNIIQMYIIELESLENNLEDVLWYSQTVEQMDLFGDMSTPPDIHSPTVMILQYTYISAV